MGRAQWLALLVVVVGVGLVVVLRGGGGGPARTGSVSTAAPPTATAPAPPPAPAPAAGPLLRLPVRAAFYYPWFPESWVQQGQDPFTNYVPTRGRYATDVATVRAQVAEMQAAHISVGIASWFGQGSVTDQHWPALLQAAQGTGFAWAPYYEPEGIGDPPPQQIADDLHQLRARYGSGLLEAPGGRMVVFVYNADDPGIPKGCETVSRWAQARQLLGEQHGESVYVDLKVFPGYRSCPATAGIDGWHEYGPNRSDQDYASAPGAGSYAISPGFWKSGVPYGAPLFLARDRARWRQSIAAMRRSGAAWQLITTYNEWGEGTAVESASGCRSAAPPGTLCDWSGGGTGSEFLADLRDAPVRP